MARLLFPKVAFAMLLVLVTFSLIALGDYAWPQFQGNAGRTGVQSSTSSEISTPKELWSKSLLGGSPAVVGDVNGDGTPEVVVGTIDGKIYVLKGGASGEALWEEDVDGAVKVAPALYDIDGDDKLEVIVGTDAGMLYALDDDGSEKWSVNIGSEVSAPVLVGDLKGSSAPEIVVGTDDGDVYAFDTNGNAVSGWGTPFTADSRITALALGEIRSGDAVKEIAVGTSSGHVYILDGNKAQLNFNNNSDLTGGAIGGIALADFEGDSDLEVVVTNFQGDVIVFYYDSGNTRMDVLASTQLTDGDSAEPVAGGPAVYDVDGDNVPEIFVATTTGKLYSLSKNGSDLETLWSQDMDTSFWSDVTLADIDGDGVMDVIVSDTDAKLYAVSADGGTELWSYTFGTKSMGPPALADIDNKTIFTGVHMLEIIVVDENETVALTAENFTPRITVTSPTERQLFTGDTVDIEWTAEDLDDNASELKITLMYRPSEGGDWTTIASDLDNTGSYTWDITDVATDEYVIKAVVTDPQGAESESQSPVFKIRNAAPTFKFTSPSVGEVLVTGDTYTIGWEVSDPDDSNDNLTIQLFYRTLGGTSWTQIDGSISGTSSSYSWTVPAAGEYELMAKVDDPYNGTVKVVSIPVRVAGSAAEKKIALDWQMSSRNFRHLGFQQGKGKTPYGVPQAKLVYSVQIGSNELVGPAVVGNIDNANSDFEIVVGDYGGNLYSKEGKDGSSLNDVNLGSPITRPIAMGEVDGTDAELEVVAVAGDTIYLREDDLSASANHSLNDSGGIPTIANVDGDSALEVIVGDSSGKLYVLDNDLTLIWSYDFGDNGIEAGAVVADINNDGVLELIAGDLGGNLRAFTAGSGTEIWGNAVDVGGPVKGLSLADLDNDGELDVIVNANHKIVAVSSDGEILWSYSISGGTILGDPAIADVDVDYDIDVAFVTTAGRVYVLNGSDGSLVWMYELGADVEAPLAVGDVNGDSQPDIVVADVSGRVVTINGQSGSKIWEYTPAEGNSFRSQPTLADVNGDEILEIVVVGTNGYMYVLTTRGPAPTVELTSPKEGWSYDEEGAGNADITFEWIATDPTGSKLDIKFYYREHGTSAWTEIAGVALTDQSPGYGSQDWDASGTLQDGHAYDFRIEVENEQGEKAYDTVENVKFDNDAPQLNDVTATLGEVAWDTDNDHTNSDAERYKMQDNIAIYDYGAGSIPSTVYFHWNPSDADDTGATDINTKIYYWPVGSSNRFLIAEEDVQQGGVRTTSSAWDPNAVPSGPGKYKFKLVVTDSWTSDDTGTEAQDTFGEITFWIGDPWPEFDDGNCSITDADGDSILESGENITFDWLVTDYTGAPFNNNQIADNELEVTFYYRKVGGNWTQISKGAGKITNSGLAAGAHQWDDDDDSHAAENITVDDLDLETGELYELKMKVYDTRSGRYDEYVAGPFKALSNADPSVEITSPAENSILDDVVEIAWNASDPDDTDGDITVTVRYKLNPNGGWVNIATNQPAEGTCYWDVSNLATGEYTISVVAQDSFGGQGEDTITVRVHNYAPTVSISSPADGSVVSSNPVSVEWSASDVDDPDDDIKIDIYYRKTGDSGWTLVANNLDNTGSYSWNIQSPSDGTEYAIKVIARDPNGKSSFDVSIFKWGVNDPPSVEIIKPTNKENIDLDAGQTYTIQWTATDPDDPDYAIKISLSYKKVSDSSWTSIASNLENTGSYTWRIPNLVAGEKYVLKVKAEDKYGGWAEDTVTFKYKNSDPDTVEILHPTAGEVVYSLYEIQWNASDPDDKDDDLTIDIYCLKKDGTLHRVIVQNHENSGSYVEDFSNPGIYPSGEYRIKVIAKDPYGGKKEQVGGVFKVRNQSPTVKVVSPKAGDFVKSSADVVVEVSDPDDAPASVEVKVFYRPEWVPAGGLQEGALYSLASCSGDSGYLLWDVKDLPAGRYALVVAAADPYRAVATAEVSPIYVNDYPVKVAPLSPKDGQVLAVDRANRPVKISWVAKDPDPNDDVRFTITIYELSDAGSVEIYGPKMVSDTFVEVPAGTLRPGRKYRLVVVPFDPPYPSDALGKLVMEFIGAPSLPVGVYPNPVRGRAKIAINIGTGGFGVSSADGPVPVGIYLYDRSRRLVRVLFEGSVVSPVFVLNWDGRDATGRPLRTGVYYLVVRCGSKVRLAKVLVMGGKQ